MKGVFQATAASSGKRPKDKREMVAGGGEGEDREGKAERGREGAGREEKDRKGGERGND